MEDCSLGGLPVCADLLVAALGGLLICGPRVICAACLGGSGGKPTNMGSNWLVWLYGLNLIFSSLFCCWYGCFGGYIVSWEYCGYGI